MTPWYLVIALCLVDGFLCHQLMKAWDKGDPPNVPLTLDELRQMGGKPYWHVGLQEDSPPPHWNVLDPFYAQHIEDYGYGKRWLAYRYELEAQHELETRSS